MLECTVRRTTELERTVDPFRGAGILALVAMILGSTSLIPVQFDPTTAMWRVRATVHFDIYYPQAHDLDSIRAKRSAPTPESAEI